MNPSHIDCLVEAEMYFTVLLELPIVLFSLPRAETRTWRRVEFISRTFRPGLASNECLFLFADYFTQTERSRVFFG